MKPKVSIVPRGQRQIKFAPDDTVYLTPCGTRVKITKAKQFPIRADEPAYMKLIREDANNRESVVRISDGHALWGYKRTDLKKEPKSS